jgi:hypothetical protein
MKRQCGSCTKCCDGWLSVEVYGNKVGNGNPCIFKKEDCGCSIYQVKPQVCQEFLCGWIRDDGTLFEEWMKPDIVNFILVYSRIGELNWYNLVQTGQDINTLMLSYVIQKALRQNINLEYWIGSTQFLIGSKEFKKYVKH